MARNYLPFASGLPADQIQRSCRSPQRIEQSLRFCPRFVKLLRCVGIRHDSCTSAKLNGGAAQSDRPNQNVEIAAAVSIEIPDRTGIRTSPASFQLADNFHTANFRATRDGAHGK